MNASFHNATFSDRIWQNHTLLKADFAKQLEIGLIQGKHPTVLDRDLRKTWDVSQYQALRLMRTELARVQIDAQMQSYDNAGVTEYTYITCGFGDACPVCRALDGRHFKTTDMAPGENAPPMHPNCHCSTAAYVDRNSIDWLKEGNEPENTAARHKKDLLTAEQLNKLKVSFKTEDEFNDYMKLLNTNPNADIRKLYRRHMDQCGGVTMDAKSFYRPLDDTIHWSIPQKKYIDAGMHK
ncbi:MAG: minor capsid protein [Lachnospiraceae bacterium]|nr:minor capsid protein [Lachnospiraceae bacterium]